jgi:hypothetical protein
MTVWQLLRILLAHASRRRGRHRVYVVIDGDLPDEMRDYLDGYDWTIVKTHVPHRRHRGDRFVVAVARPQPAGVPDRDTYPAPVPISAGRRSGVGRDVVMPSRRAG